MDHEQSFWTQVGDVAEGYSVVVEDDGKVAYAYLHDPSHAIIGDVWLYNRGPTPKSVDWANRDLLPFANPQDFASATTIEPLQREADVMVQWKRASGQPLQANLYIRGELFAVLKDGSTPGWSRLAAKKRTFGVGAGRLNRSALGQMRKRPQNAFILEIEAAGSAT